MHVGPRTGRPAASAAAAAAAHGKEMRHMRLDVAAAGSARVCSNCHPLTRAAPAAYASCPAVRCDVACAPSAPGDGRR